VATGFLLNDLGALATPLMYCFREREKILDLFEMLCGARITVSYMRVGGVFQDAPEDFWPAFKTFLEEMPYYIDEYEQFLVGNEILLMRLKGGNTVSKEQALNASITGPVLRSTGFSWDLRKVDPYEIYDRFDFDIPVGEQGDNFDRFYIRLQEMRESLRILNQCFKQIAPGPVRANVPYLYRPPAGDAYGRVESPKGELGFYLVSDGGIAPYRCKIRSPSLLNLSAIKEMLVGWKLADMIVTLGSIDINMGEVDR